MDQKCERNRIYMDGRGWKGIKKKEIVAGAAFFLLFSLLMTAVFAESFRRNETVWKKENIELIGRMAEQFPGQELQLMEAVHGQMQGKSEDAGADRKDREELHRKKSAYQVRAEELLAAYGYENRDTEWENGELLRESGFFFCVFFLIGGIFLLGGWQYRRRKVRTALGSLEERLALLNAGKYEKAVRESEEKILEEDNFAKVEAQIAFLGRKTELLMERMQREKEGVKSLVTDISHQLKTPLASLKLELELALEKDAVWKKGEPGDFMERMQAEVRRLESLTEGLKNVSKMEAEMVQLRPEWCELKETLIRAVNAVYMKAFEKGIEIELREDYKKQLFYDRKWMQEVFINILDNAVKYSGEGTTIRIRVEELQNSVVTEIEDAGIGIPKKEYPEVFKRFYRGERKEVQEQEGAGVGLYLVRKIVELHGGSVMIRPAAGGGTIFRVILQKNDSFVRKDESKM